MTVNACGSPDDRQQVGQSDHRGRVDDEHDRRERDAGGDQDPVSACDAVARLRIADGNEQRQCGEKGASDRTQRRSSTSPATASAARAARHARPRASRRASARTRRSRPHLQVRFERGETGERAHAERANPNSGSTQACVCDEFWPNARDQTTKCQRLALQALRQRESISVEKDQRRERSLVERTMGTSRLGIRRASDLRVSLRISGVLEICHKSGRGVHPAGP